MGEWGVRLSGLGAGWHAGCMRFAGVAWDAEGWEVVILDDWPGWTCCPAPWRAAKRSVVLTPGRVRRAAVLGGGVPRAVADSHVETRMGWPALVEDMRVIPVRGERRRHRDHVAKSDNDS
jgi:hypothetical protein